MPLEFMELLNKTLTAAQMSQLVKCDVIALPGQPADQLRALPDVSAVYFFVFGSIVGYVGQSARLVKRFPSHHHLHRLKRFDARVTYMKVPDNVQLRKKIERAFIERLQPQLNCNVRRDDAAWREITRFDYPSPREFLVW